MPAMIAAGKFRRKIPRRNHHAHTQRNIDEIIFLALHGHNFLRTGQPQHLPPIKFQKIDGLRGVCIRLRPSLPCLINNQRVHFVLTLAQNLRRAEQALHSLLRRHPLPCLKSLCRRLHCLIGLLRARGLKHADHLRRMRRIRRRFLLRRDHFLPANVHGVLAAKLPRDLLERFFHAFAVFGPRKIDKRLVHEFGNVRFGLGSRHVSSPNEHPILLRRSRGRQGANSLALTSGQARAQQCCAPTKRERLAKHGGQLGLRLRTLAANSWAVAGRGSVPGPTG